jgi:hypothetical protein
MIRRRFRILVQTLSLLFLVTALVGGPSTKAPAQAAPYAFKLAYVYYGNQVDANGFKGLLTSSFPGSTVDLIPLSSVLATDFSLYDMTLIADDTGRLNSWGIPTNLSTQIEKLTMPNRPIFGIGEGGYAFFGKLSLFIGWPHGWHGPQLKAQKAGTPEANAVFGTLLSSVDLFTEPVNAVGIYLPGAPTDVIAIGLETTANDHANQVMQGCRFLWGNSGAPSKMTGDGTTLFLNSILYALNFKCPVEQTSDPKSLNVYKTPNPAIGTTVLPGQVIDYTLSYTFLSANLGGATSAILKDKIPMDTIFVPGSASDGISPTPDGELAWTVGPGTGDKHFKVIVSDTQCADQSMVNNLATLHVTGYTQVYSNPAYHPVTCPPVVFPNSSIFYAEDEVAVHPYPLIAGRPSRVSVRLTNISTAASPVTVQFQSGQLGIGMSYTTFDTQSVTIPAGGVTELSSLYTPPVSGQASFQVLISGSPPLFTQSSLDVSEDFKPGVPDAWQVPVRNNTSSTGDINLVIVNTCPGWTAAVEPATLFSMDPDTTGGVTFTVTPPDRTPLGTGCHIDLQGWIGTTMIGGIRKLDVPPVHLPPNVNPPWEEPEIVPVPNPPVAGVPGQLCIELVNPFDTARDVTVDFSVADFGAGIGFAPVASKIFHLPAYSSGRYCADWTPAGTGTLHRCILATLKQTGFLDMRSQRNMDIVRSDPATLSTVKVPFRVSNPDGIAHHLTFQFTLVGIDPIWTPRILTPIGDPAPDVLMGDGSVHDLMLDFITGPAFGPQAAALASGYRTGGNSKVEVAVLLDGRQVGGFTVSLQNALYLPLIRR